ncbi:hypothetical protein Bca4012_101349 [Brassica carinata]
MDVTMMTETGSQLSQYHERREPSEQIKKKGNAFDRRRRRVREIEKEAKGWLKLDSSLSLFEVSDGDQSRRLSSSCYRAVEMSFPLRHECLDFELFPPPQTEENNVGSSNRL